MAKQYVQLSVQSRRIIDAAISAAYKNDLQNGTLHTADEYLVRINSTWILKNKMKSNAEEKGDLWQLYKMLYDDVGVYARYAIINACNDNEYATDDISPLTGRWNHYI